MRNPADIDPTSVDIQWQGLMVALIDAKLRAWSDRTLIESRDVLDLLLDLRSIVAPHPSRLEPADLTSQVAVAEPLV